MIKGEEKLKGLDKRIVDCVYAHHENTKNQYDTIVVFGYRSGVVQAALFAQGREELKYVNQLRDIAGLAPITEKENKKTVTKARQGQSAHEFFAGVDLVGELIHDKDKQPEWDDMDYFRQLKEEATKRGLITLWSIGDFGHVEIPDWKV